MPIYKDKKATKDGRCWYFKVNYTDVINWISQIKNSSLNFIKHESYKCENKNKTM